MIRPHSDQRSIPVAQRHPAFSSYDHLVNAPVLPLDSYISALISENARQGIKSGSALVVDGEVITSSVTIPVRMWDDHDPATIAPESKRSLVQRAIDDPYWILMTLTIMLGVSITATIVYGIIQITLAVARWFATNDTILAVITALAVLLMLCGGATAAKCAGIHCGGCRG